MNATQLNIGDVVPDFTIETFDPTKTDFADVTLESIKKKKKWTVLFFYPGDFTFVCPTELADLAKVHWEEGDKTLKPSAKLVGKVYEALK